MKGSVAFFTSSSKNFLFTKLCCAYYKILLISECIIIVLADAASFFKCFFHLLCYFLDFLSILWFIGLFVFTLMLNLLSFILYLSSLYRSNSCMQNSWSSIRLTLNQPSFFLVALPLVILMFSQHT